MSTPAGITRIDCTLGVFSAQESGADLGAVVTVTASRPALVWAATGEVLFSDPYTISAADGGAITVPLIPTDLDGWLVGGLPLEIADGEHTHTYDIKVQPVATVAEGKTRKVGEPVYYKRVVVPADTEGALDLDTSAEVSSPAGGTVTVPDLVSGLAAAVAADADRAETAAAAAEAVGDTNDTIMAGVAADTDSDFYAVQTATSAAQIATSVRPGAFDSKVSDLGFAWDLATLGDSLTQALQDDGIPWSRLLSEWLGLATYNPAISGEASNDIAFRQGGLAPIVTVSGNTIPADGSPVTITSISPNDQGWRGTGVGASADLGRFPGVTLCGVVGTVIHEQNVSGTGAWTFTPDAAPGTAISVPPNSRMRVNASKSARSAIQIIGLGRNFPDQYNMARALDWMRDYMVPVGGEKRWITWGVLTAATGSSTADRDGVYAANAYLAAQFPDNYVDVLTFLRSTAALAEAGISPTAQDTADIAAGIIPTSLRVESTNLHLNRHGKLVLARRLALAMIDREWIDTTSIFIPPPLGSEEASAALMPTASAYANAAQPSEVATAPDLSVRVILTPTATIPTGPVNILNSNSGATGRHFGLYALGNGQIRWQVWNAGGAVDFRDSVGKPAWVVGAKIGLRVDYKPSTNAVAFFTSDDDGATWDSVSTASMNTALVTTTTTPLKLGEGFAMNVDSAEILSYDAATTLLSEDFTDGSASGWTFSAGASLGVPWDYA